MSQVVQNISFDEYYNSKDKCPNQDDCARVIANQYKAQIAEYLKLPIRK